MRTILVTFIDISAWWSRSCEKIKRNGTRLVEHRTRLQAYDILRFKTSNVTSALTNEDVILSSGAHILATQEHCLNEARTKPFQAIARAKGKRFEGGPLDPEAGRRNAGVRAVTLQGLIPYPIPSPTADYSDAVVTGRSAIHHTCSSCCLRLGRRKKKDRERSKDG